MVVGGPPPWGLAFWALGARHRLPCWAEARCAPTPSGREVVCAYRGTAGLAGVWHGRGKTLVAPDETRPVGRPEEGAPSQPAHWQPGREASLGRRRLLKALGQPFSSEKQLQRQGEQRGLKAPVCNRSIPHLPLVSEQTPDGPPLGSTGKSLRVTGGAGYLTPALQAPEARTKLPPSCL